MLHQPAACDYVKQWMAVSYSGIHRAIAPVPSPAIISSDARHRHNDRIHSADPRHAATHPDINEDQRPSSLTIARSRKSSRNILTDRHPTNPGTQVCPSIRNTSSSVFFNRANSPRCSTITIAVTSASNASSLPRAFAITPRDNPAYNSLSRRFFAK